jgi:molybdate transport system substrate-binding protein
METLRNALALACLALATASLACGGGSEGRDELVVYAATSTRDVLLALEPTYEREHRVDLVFNFGSSGDLSKQIVAAAQADVFLSADEKEMDRVESAGLVAAGTRLALLSNQLVVIEPADAPSRFTEPFEPAQLAAPGIELLSLANVETVPAGRYAKAWLEETGVWSHVSERVVPGVDVRAALAAVESAGAQAGIVYRTDAALSKEARIVFAVPVDEGPRISYPVAVLASRPADEDARAFVDFLAGREAGAVFERFGFVRAARSASGG